MLSSGQPTMSFERLECWESLLPWTFLAILSPLRSFSLLNLRSTSLPSMTECLRKAKLYLQTFFVSARVYDRIDMTTEFVALLTSTLKLLGDVWWRCPLRKKQKTFFIPTQAIRIAFNLSQSKSIRKGFVYIHSRLPHRFDSLHHRNWLFILFLISRRR